MAEQNTTSEKQVAIQKIYTKDLSFETPNSPQIFREKWEPALDFNLRTDANKLDETIFEINLQITITVKSQDKVAYLVEVNQAGIFTLVNFTEQELGPMLGSFCPNVLFPYAREVISDLVNKGGFPQFLLAPVNFDALYAQRVQQMQQNTGSQSIN